ncbi:hypothetical protein HDV00_008239, partial [Rhizophlyctis rosea]
AVSYHYQEASNSRDVRFGHWVGRLERRDGDAVSRVRDCRVGGKSGIRDERRDVLAGLEKVRPVMARFLRVEGRAERRRRWKGVSLILPLMGGLWSEGR